MLMHKFKIQQMLEKCSCFLSWKKDLAFFLEFVEKNYQALKVLLLCSKNLLQLEFKNQTLW